MIFSRKFRFGVTGLLCILWFLWMNNLLNTETQKKIGFQGRGHHRRTAQRAETPGGKSPAAAPAASSLRTP